MTALITITLLSVTLAVAMTAYAFRLAREARRRSEARVEALAADIHQVSGEERASPVTVNGLFTAEMRRDSSPSFRALAIGAVIVGATLAAMIAGAGRSRQQVGERPSPSPVESRVPAAPAPLELTHLEHDAERDALVIRGTVVDKNDPPSNTSLTAAVFALDGNGAVVGTGSAPLEIASTSAPGGVESSFVVKIAGARDIRRYRVSFRSGDRTVAHVDRRMRLVTAQLP
jgi:hypothetical protein